MSEMFPTAPSVRFCVEVSGCRVDSLQWAVTEYREPVAAPWPRKLSGLVSFIQEATPTVPHAEHTFELPVGVTDADGVPQRNGVMRTMTTEDLQAAHHDPLVQSNPAYLTIIILSRVLTRLGSMDPVTTQDIERLTTKDFLFLQELHQRINAGQGSPEA